MLFDIVGDARDISKIEDHKELENAQILPVGVPMPSQ